MDMPLSSFKSRLMTISTQLTKEDLDNMKFVLEDFLPKGKLQNVQKPHELFSLMIEAGLLSEDNLSRLAEVLKSAGRLDLSNELLQVALSQAQPVEGEIEYILKTL